MFSFSTRLPALTPAKVFSGSLSESVKVRGTSAGSGFITLRPKFLAILYPKLLAPILGIDGPPHAITTLSAVSV